jgi:hypothetical protein
MSANSTEKDTRTGAKVQPAPRGRISIESPNDTRALAALTFSAVVLPVALYFLIFLIVVMVVLNSLPPVPW